MKTWDKLPYDDIPDLPRLNDFVRWYAEQNPDAEACIDFEGRRLSYKDLAHEVDVQSAKLRQMGVEKGDVLALLSPPAVEFWIFFLSTIEVGATFLGLNPRYTEKELCYIAEAADPKFVFICQKIGETHYDEHIMALKNTLSGPERVIPYDLGSLAQVFENIENRADGHAIVSSDNQLADHCLLVFTSGTTGRPKGALLSEEGLVFCSRVQAHHQAMPMARGLNPLPINHVGCVFAVGTAALVAGSTIIFMPFEPVDMLRAIETERCNLMGGIPTMLQLMFSVEEAKHTDFSTIERILWSGAPMPRPLGEFIQSFGQPLHTFYGMTETTGSVTFTDPDASLDDCIETIGKPDPHYKVRIADPTTGADCPIGETGEIQVKSPGILKEYLNDPAATKASFTADGFFKTGDLAYQREDGSYVLNGRIKEMFKSGGYNVYPREVEAAIEQLNDIAIACVVPVPDATYFEVGYAYLVPSHSNNIDPENLKSKLKQILANFKIPKYFEILQEPPILPSGKIDKITLKNRAAKTVESQSDQQS